MTSPATHHSLISAGEYFSALYAIVQDGPGVRGEVRCFGDAEGSKHHPQIYFGTLADVGEWAEDLEKKADAGPEVQKGYGCFYGLQPRVRDRGKDEDISIAVAIGIDFDGGVDLARKNLERAPWPPSAAIMTGHGIHGIWFLDRPWEFESSFVYSRIVKAIATELGADAKATNPSRVLRAPGSWNVKYKPIRTVLDELHPDRRYDIDRFIGWVEEIEAREPKAAPAQSDRPSVKPSSSSISTGTTPYGAAALAGIVAQVRSASAADRNRNNTYNAAVFRAGQLHYAGHLEERDAYDAIVSAAAEIGLTAVEISKTWRSGFEAGQAKPDPKIPDPNARQHRPKPDAAAPVAPAIPTPSGEIKDFVAYLPTHSYIHRPTRAHWPAASVNAVCPPVKIGVDDKGKVQTLPANKYLDHANAVSQSTWFPGYPEIITGQHITTAGWIPHPSARVFNEYRPPIKFKDGDPDQAGKWIDHVATLYPDPDHAAHILQWLAHRVQRPQEKVNHALVLGGAPGIGKDSILAPVRFAVGPWNCQDINPGNLVERFNDFVKSVLLVISEANDTGPDSTRYAAYERSKTIIAGPPDFLRIDQKFRDPHYAPNLCGVVITTNHRTGGLYLPPDDRRHFVVWSEVHERGMPPGYFSDLWRWFLDGGIGHVAAFLRTADISAFDPKAPPLRTEAFRMMVDAAQAPENADLAHILESLHWPDAVTLFEIRKKCEFSDPPLFNWLNDRRNSRQIAKRLEDCGYLKVINPDRKTGVWSVHGTVTTVYGRRDQATPERVSAARNLVEKGRGFAGESHI